MMTKFHSPTPPHPESQIEIDSRFPSGPWCGFFLMSHLPGRHQMELHLTFRQGVMTGEGRDQIGAFLIRGRYQVEDGQCWWTKRYISKHDVSYRGYNEGKGIWPEAMGDPTQQKLAEAIDQPVEIEMEAGAGMPVEAGVQVGEHAAVSAGAW